MDNFYRIVERVILIVFFVAIALLAAVIWGWIKV